MKVTKVVRVDTEVVEDIRCNKCGETCVKFLGGSKDFKDFYGLIEAVVSGGYESTDLEDTVTYTFSLCEKCLKELFDTFKIPVKRSGLYENISDEELKNCAEFLAAERENK